jgi:methyl-accepting chemotaxis protein
MALMLALPVLAIGAMGLYGVGFTADALRTERLAELRRQIDTALTAFAHAQATAQAAGATPEEAAQTAAKAVEALRYGNGDYFFVQRGTTLVAHGGNPALAGKDLSGLRDPDGVMITRELNRQASATGEAELAYKWPRVKDAEPEPKLSYARAIPGTDLLIGTGVFVSDLEATNAEMRGEVLTFAGIAAAVLAALTFAIGRSITGPLARLRARMAGLADGDLDSPIPDADARDEIGAMARGLEVFREQAASVRRLEDEKKASAEAAEAERRAMLDGLGASFGAIVDAAAGGDFSRRIDRRYDDPVLEKMAGGLNALLDTVQSGLAESGRVLARLAEGDLTHRMGGSYRGAFAEMQTNVNSTVERLRGLLQQVRGLTQRIAQDAGTITGSAHDLSTRSESQAASLEETAATMEEISSTVKSNATHADDVARSSADARAQGDRGGKVVGQAVDAMRGIETGSTKISEIVSVIDGFAFQTNLLALNAAVEAARAGEAGKGFAVVASEVRSLAQRSAEAARDIKALIDESGAQVSDGVRLVEETGKALQGLVEAIGHVGGMVDEIATATKEQASGVEEISSAIGSLDRITQENAALADRSAQVAEALAERSRELGRAMDAFRLGDDSSAWDRDAADDAARLSA